MAKVKSSNEQFKKIFEDEEKRKKLLLTQEEDDKLFSDVQKATSYESQIVVDENAGKEYLRQKKIDDIGVLGRVQAGFEDESALFNLYNYTVDSLEDSTYDLDVTFKDTDKARLLDEAGIRKDRQDMLIGRARNEYHLSELISIAEKEQAREDALNDSFAGGLLYRGVGAIADYIPMAFLPPLSVGAKAYMTATKARRFAIGAGLEGAIEATKSVVNDRERTVIENVLAPTLGGMFSMALTKPYAKELIDSIEDTKKIVKQSSGLTDNELDEIEKLKLDDTADNTQQVNEIVSNAVKRRDAELIEARQRKSPTDAMDIFVEPIQGIAPVIKDRDVLGEALGQLEYMNKVKSISADVYDKFRFDLSHYNQTNSSETSREFFNNFFSDPLLYKTHIDHIYGGDVQTSMLHTLSTVVDKNVGALRKEINEEFRNETSFIKFNPSINGLLETYNTAQRDILDSMLGDIQIKRRDNIFGMSDRTVAVDYATKELTRQFGFTKEVAEKYANKMVDSGEKIGTSFGSTMKQFGVEKFVNGEIKVNPLYIPNQYRYGVLDELANNNITSDTVGNFLSNSWLKNKNDKVKTLFATPEAKAKLDTAMYNWMKYSTSENKGIKQLLEDDMLTVEIKKQFKNDDAVLRFMNTRPQEGSVFTRHRKTFDRSHTEDGLDFSMFMEKNIDVLAQKYARSSSGMQGLAIAGKQLANRLDANGKPKFGNLSTREGISNLYEKMIKEINDGTRSPQEKHKERVRLHYTFKQLLGESTVVNPTGIGHRAVTILNNLTTGLLLPQGGLSQVAELSTLMSKFGAKNFLSNSATGLEALKLATTGAMKKDSFANAMYQTFNVGAELNRSPMSLRYDTAVNSVGNNIGKDNRSAVERVSEWAENASHKFAHSTLMVSGLIPNNTLLQSGFIGSTMDLMLRYNTLGKADKLTIDKILKQEMGLSQKSIDKVLDNMNRYAVWTDGDKLYKTDGSEIAGRVEWRDTLDEFIDEEPIGLKDTIKEAQEILFKQVPEFADKVKVQTLLDMDQVTPEAVQRLYPNTFENDYVVADVMNYVKEATNLIDSMAKKFPVESTEFVDKISKGVLGTNIANIINNTSKVQLSRDMLSSSLRDMNEVFNTFAHELIHSGTVIPYTKIKEYKTMVDSVLDDARSAIPNVKKEYGLKNGKELLAEAFSNPTFAEKLNELTPSAKTIEDFGKLEVNNSRYDDILDMSMKVMDIKLNEGSLLDMLVKATKMTDAEQVVKFSKEGYVAGKKVANPNIEKWDRDISILFRTAMDRVVNTYIQKSELKDTFAVTMGDGLLKDNPIGRLALNLKNYAVTSYTKQLGRTIANWDNRAGIALGAQLGAMTGVNVIKAVMNNYGDEEKMKEALDPKVLTAKVLMTTNIASYTPSIFNATEMLLTGDDKYSNSATAYGVSGFAGARQLNALADAISTPANIIEGNPYEAGRKVLPFIPEYPIVSGWKKGLDSDLKEMSKEVKDEAREESSLEDLLEE